jgi:hypothetical protein
MKKTYLLCMILWVGAYCFAQNENEGNSYPLIKIAEFENKNEPGCYYIRKPEEVGPQDDFTGNYIMYDEKGNLIVFQDDSGRMIFYDKDYKVRNEIQTSLKESPFIVTYQNEKILFNDLTARLYLLSKDGKMIFSVNFFDMELPRIGLTSAYYDEDSDVLFFIDDSYKMHSILHPGMDEAENRKNYRDPEATVKLFEADSGVDLHGLTRDEKGRIFKNGKYIGPNFTPVVGKYRYEWSTRSLGISDGYKLLLATRIQFPVTVDEIYESTAVHPSGDIYILRYNTKINKHILYKIENTWDKDAKSAWENKQSRACQLQ